MSDNLLPKFKSQKSLKPNRLTEVLGNVGFLQSWGSDTMPTL